MSLSQSIFFMAAPSSPLNLCPNTLLSETFLEPLIPNHTPSTPQTVCTGAFITMHVTYLYISLTSLHPDRLHKSKDLYLVLIAPALRSVPAQRMSKSSQENSILTVLHQRSDNKRPEN